MYIGNRHTSTTTATQIKNFECAYCSHKSIVQVTGIGQGQGNSPYFLDETGAKERAQGHANKNAIKNINETLSIVKCPKCFRRNEDNIRKFWIANGGKLVGGAVFFAALAFLVYAITDEKFVFTIFGIIGPLTLVLIYFLDIKWRWETADKRVVFLE